MLVNTQALCSIVKDASALLGAITNKFAEIGNLGSELKSLSAQTGQSVRDLVLLRQAFQNAGMDAGQVSASAAKLQKALGGISEEGASTVEAFRRLNVSAAQLKNLSFAEQLQRLSKGFAGVTNAAERSAIAQQLFGRSGSQMLALFASGAGLEQASREVGGMADLMERNAKVFDEFANHVRTAKGKVDEFVAGALSALAPALDKAAALIAGMDFTGVGATVGGMVAPLVTLVETIIKFKGHIASIALGFAAMKVASLPALSALNVSMTSVWTAARAQMASFSASLTTLPVSFATVKTAAVTCFTAIKGAIASTGLGLLVVVLGEIAARVMSFTANWNGVIDSVKDANAQAAAFHKEIRGAMGSVTGETTRAKLLDDINQKIEQQREALLKLGGEDLNTKQYELKKQTIESTIGLLKVHAENVKKISREEMEANAEAIIAAERAAEVERKALELRKNLGKQQEDIAKAVHDAEMSGLTPLEKRGVLMKQISGLMKELNAENEVDLQLKVAQGTLTNEEVLLYSKLLDLKKQVIDLTPEARRETKNNAKKDLERQEIERQRRLSDIRAQVSLVQNNSLATTADKYAALRPLMEQERAELEKNIVEWTALAEARRLANDTQGMDEMLAKISEAKLRIAEIMNDPATLSFGDTVQAKLVSFADSFGTMAEQVGGAITGSIGTAINGISQGMSGLIMGTMSWRDAMRQTVTSIITNLIQVMTQMVVMNALGSMLGKKSTAETSINNATIAATAAPAAAMNSIASWGTAATIGVAALMAGLMMVMGMIAGGFKDGGLIPGASSDRDNRLAAVATGEFVMRSAAVRKYGAGVFDAFNSLKVPRDGFDFGSLPVPAPRSSLAFAAGGLVGEGQSLEERGQMQTHVMVFDDRKKMDEYMRGVEGRRIIYDAVSERRVDLGMNT